MTGVDEPSLSMWRSPEPAKGVALVLHGGAEHGAAVVRPWRLAYLRMVPMARDLAAAGRAEGLHVALLRNRVRGWNAPALDAVRDARWALDRLTEEYPGLPIVLVGHSMGGRVALRIADDPAVRGVCALAPWTPRAEPVQAVSGKAVLIAHGTRDRITDPAASHSFGERALPGASRLARFEVAEDGHAMLRRSMVWRRLVRAFVLETLGLAATDDLLREAWSKPHGERLRIPV
ncbi:alpha/beta hydrolase [Amycolatopsis palatopharyngis]|uniref:alpha/beta hydrolase n=1 Tax=Amycolatopsis palatopharyngis TaxID=187982 RepID=UPI000E23B129|nr:alpha/beta fold hydrolase [Amycolatopsis palatopharyngis]